jgi:hypothetical protein
MDLDAFRDSLTALGPPETLDSALQGLWWDAKGDWDSAHRCAQEEDGSRTAWVHAYLHRKEGDLANAAYWYRRAGRPVGDGDLDREWAAIARALLPGT